MVKIECSKKVSPDCEGVELFQAVAGTVIQPEEIGWFTVDGKPVCPKCSKFLKK